MWNLGDLKACVTFDSYIYLEGEKKERKAGGKSITLNTTSPVN